ncbi:flippase-like domain-containing protein [Cupriavidus pampae]|uniref:TIGR00374 family protein n=1 Tax=Cupriavidus pampae TaxID=659251 RepID=A0ABM8XN56_9BURK|nr:flippase-like domain-containing protein [Cupriavidus pampae]CAG9181670.1 hypothetical protein LMG32289_04897 [Cupriavidus pampae]
MTRAAVFLFTIGAALFVALLAWRGFDAVVSTLLVAKWGLALIAAFHLIPLLLDAASIWVLMHRHGEGKVRDAIFTRWVGESVNSLLPAGQLGGPVLMVRYLSHRGARIRDAAAAITVSTTAQALSQILFALGGILLFSANGGLEGERAPIIAVTVVLTLSVVGFMFLQRRGMFGHVLRLLQKVMGKRDWKGLTVGADAVDEAIRELYGEKGRVAASFFLNLIGWIIGTGEVWLIMHFLGHPVSWVDALLLESVGQAIRGAAFAIPGSLGAQEGGYLLLAPLVGLPPDMALALSLAKRVRELILGLPGLLYLHLSERKFQRRRAALEASE